MKAIAYYRTRPSEPEASDLALRLQQEAVRIEVEQHGLDLVAEFIEREGEEGSEAYPAYVAAVRAASASNGREGTSLGGEVIFDTVLIIPTLAAIGTGEPFRDHTITVEGAGTGGPLWSYLMVPTSPVTPEIALPAGAPGPLCLYADFRPSQLDTLIYLCNTGPQVLADVVVSTNTINMNDYFASEHSEERWAEGRTHEQRWDVVPPGACVLVASISHVINDRVSRYRLAYSDPAGRRWTTEAHDFALTSCLPPQDPDEMWVAFAERALRKSADVPPRPRPTRRGPEAS